MEKIKRRSISFTLTPPSIQRLTEMAKERDMPRAVLIRQMLNFAIKKGFN